MSRSRNRRDVRTISNHRLPISSYVTRSIVPLSYSNPFTDLRRFEDRRSWNPERQFAPAKSFSRPRHRLVIGEPVRSRVSSGRGRSYRNVSWPSARVGFERPDKVLVCVRRQQRKEVLHAFRKTGRVGQRRPRWNLFSSVSCRR